MIPAPRTSSSPAKSECLRIPFLPGHRPQILGTLGLCLVFLTACGGGGGESTPNPPPPPPAVTAPSITQQPQNRAVTQGQTATFTVSAAGTAPLSYQWKKNGTAVGGNASSYTTPATTLADDGAIFRVTVSNSAGQLESSAATLTVSAPSTGTYYVSPSGDDTFAGSSAAPWKTIQKAANTLSAGETAIVRPGIYNEIVTLNRGGSGDAQRVRLVSETPRGAKCTRLLIKADYVSIDGFEIEAQTLADPSGITIQGSAGTEIANCYIHDCPLLGIDVSYSNISGVVRLPSHTTLRGNTLDHNGQVGIRLKGSYGWVENNTISRTVAYHPKINRADIQGTDADGMHLFGDHHTIRGNVIANIGDPAENDITGTGAPHVDAFQSWDRASLTASEIIVTDTLIENNTCWSNHPYSKGLIVESVNGMASHHLTVRNNIFEFRDAGIFIQQYTPGAPHHDLTISNNIFTAKLADSPWGVGICLTEVVNYQVDNNLTIDCHPEHRKITGGSGFVDYNFAWNSDGSAFNFTNPVAQAHERKGDPGFVGFTGVHGSNDYRFRADSTLIDQGNPATAATTDCNGVARPQGSGFDPGPYEYKSCQPFTSSVTLTKWRDAKTAALVLQFDDSTPGQARLGLGALGSRNLPGTWYINPGLETYQDNLAYWESAPALHQELANHTMNHTDVSDLTQMQAEVADAAREIWRIRGHAENGSLMAFCQSDSTTWTWTAEQKAQILADLSNVDRQANPGPTYSGYKAYTVPTAASSDAMYTLVPTIIESGNWGKICFHGITAVADTTDSGYGAVHIDAFNAFLDRLTQEGSQLWFAGQIQLYKYAQEQQHTTATFTEQCSERIAFDLISTLGPLYDEPLTLRVQVPPTWTQCRVIQDSRETLRPVTSGSVLIDAVPNLGEVVLMEGM
jgi:parallel beta-helix repeat protein